MEQEKERNYDAVYENHQIVEESEKRVLMMRIDDEGEPRFAFWIEFILGRSGTLMLHGDGPDMMYRWYSNNDMRTYVEFVARGGCYPASKVCSGTTEIFSEEEFENDLREYLDGRVQGEGISPDREDELFEDVMSEGRLGEYSGVYSKVHAQCAAVEVLSKVDPDVFEVVGGWGVSQSPEIMLCEAAARRLITLWDEREKKLAAQCTAAQEIASGCTAVLEGTRC